MATVTTSKSGTTGPTKMFVRNATGLVRELTAFDAFNLVFAAVLIPVGISQALNFGAAAFPGANIALAFILGAILLLGFGGVYVYFTLAMPRSGGDYVWVSRSLHPFFGFVVNVTLTFVFVNWVAFNFTTMMNMTRMKRAANLVPRSISRVKSRVRIEATRNWCPWEANQPMSDCDQPIT